MEWQRGSRERIKPDASSDRENEGDLWSGRWASGAVTGAVDVGVDHAVEEAGVAPVPAGATVGAAAAALAVEKAAVARPTVEEPPAVAVRATRKPQSL